MIDALAQFKSKELIEHLKAISVKPEAGAEFNLVEFASDDFLCVSVNGHHFIWALSWLWHNYHESRTYDRSIEFLVQSTTDLLRCNDALMPEIEAQIVAEQQQAKG